MKKRKDAKGPASVRLPAPSDNEFRYQTLVDNLNAGVAVYRAVNDGDDFIFVDFNKGGERIEQVSREDVVGKSVLEVFPGVSEFGLFEVFRRVWRTGMPELHPIGIYRDDRIAGWRENFVYKLPSGEIVAVYEDRTEQKQAEEALRKSEEQFRNYINQAPYAVFVANEKGDFIVINEAACRTTGYSADELLTMNMIALIPPADRGKALDHFHSVVNTGKAFGELMYQTKQGEQRVWTVNAVKLNDRMMMGFANDVTDMKRAQDEILDYQRQLQAMSSELALAEERQRRMVATELHDGIGQLLSVTKIKMQRLLSDLRNSGQVKEIAQILDLIVRALHDSRALIFELSPPMLYELGLEAAIEWLGEQFRTRYGLAFEFHDDGQPKPLSEDKRVLLFQIVRELFYNVVKHAQARTLSARMERQDDRYRIRIEDDGIGFAWNPAGSGESASGFGLFSIRERLRYIGGSIEIQPRPAGGGTRVLIEAPL